MGDDINVHDQWAVESMGAIQDRTREHLGASDKAIAAYRRLLVRAIRDVAEGRKPLLALPPEQAAAIRGPASIDAIGPVEGWQAFWQEQDRARRSAAPWNAMLAACLRRWTASSTGTASGRSSRSTPPPPSTPRIAEELGVVRLAFVDAHGVLRGKTLVGGGGGARACVRACAPPRRCC